MIILSSACRRDAFESILFAVTIAQPVLARSCLLHVQDRRTELTVLAAAGATLVLAGLYAFNSVRGGRVQVREVLSRWHCAVNCLQDAGSLDMSYSIPMLTFHTSTLIFCTRGGKVSAINLYAQNFHRFGMAM